MASLARSLSTRVAKRLEKPKPLKALIPNRHSFSDKEYLQSSSNSDLLVDSKPPDTSVRSAEDVLVLLDLISSNIQNKDYSNILPLTSNLISRLKNYGSSLEEYHEEKLDKTFEVLRTGAHDINLDKQTRLNLLQLVELRAAQWQMPPGFSSYYASRSCYNIEASEIYGDSAFDYNLQLLGPGDVLKSSGKYSSPTRVPGKNYCKDEVVIRNSDSGKVMGIKGRRVHMIEELSETVISFQRVNPGAKERLVQITGPSEDKIIYAKNLIEDTIKRNASPVREMGIGVGSCEVVGSNSSINSSASDESNRLLSTTGRPAVTAPPKDSTEFKYSVHVMNDVIHISSTNLNLLNDAFSLLDSSYTCPEDPTLAVQNARFVQNSTLNFQSESQAPDFYPHSVGEGRHSESDKSSVGSQDSGSNPALNDSGFLRQYSRQFLLDCSTTKSACMIPPNWNVIADLYPGIVKQSPTSFDAAAYQKRWLETDGKIISSLSANAEDFLDSD